MHAVGYAGFKALHAVHRMQKTNCWANARRKFYDIAKNSPAGFAEDGLNRMAKLYAIEDDIRGLASGRAASSS